MAHTKIIPCKKHDQRREELLIGPGILDEGDEQEKRQINQRCQVDSVDDL